MEGVEFQGDATIRIGPAEIRLHSPRKGKGEMVDIADRLSGVAVGLKVNQEYLAAGDRIPMPKLLDDYKKTIEALSDIIKDVRKLAA